jgi:hypothetical protein
MEAICRACGANIDIAEDMDSGERIPLERNTDPSADADRYRIVEVNPLRVRQVPKAAAGDYYPDHRFDCKDFNAGRTF